MKKVALLVLCGLTVFSTFASPQSAPEMRSGTKEIEFFVAGGHSVAGGRGNTGAFQAGARFGRVLFKAPEGNLEYTIDFIPIYYIAQVQNAYGVSFTPFNLKYNFTSFGRGFPYLELGGGVLFTNHDVPDGTNTVNFTPQAGIGVQVPLKRSNDYFGLALKYIHISNAGLATPNPGLNTLQVKLSVGRYRHH
ncbi:MAG TPA: acyloxyacyl hydrolase [Terriglobales bacterium]|nr:acyloxyacyl hydrolase [Terriglobales bacterium]